MGEERGVCCGILGVFGAIGVASWDGEFRCMIMKTSFCVRLGFVLLSVVFSSLDEGVWRSIAEQKIPRK